MSTRKHRNLAFLDSLQGLFRHRRSDRATIRSHQDRQVRRLVRFAYEQVPFWRRRFLALGVDPAEIQGVADLPRVPPVERSELQEASVPELVASYLDPGRLYAHRTSGATGVPVTFRRTPLEQRLLGIFRKRAFLDMGISPRARVAWVALPRREHQESPGLIRRLMYSAGFYRLRKFSCLLEMPELASQLEAWRPDVLIGFGATVARLADYLVERSDSAGLEWHPRHTVVSGEVVTDPMRRTIARAFGEFPLEMYGSVEFGLIGWRRRPDSPLIVADDAVVLEVLRDGRPVAVGEEGEAVITGLLSWSMPLIRYRIGDVVVRTSPAPEDARRWPFEALSQVQGRQLDRFTLSDGRRIHSWHVTMPVVLDNPWIRQYRIVQEDVDRFSIFVVPESPPGDGSLRTMQDRARQVLGAGVQVEIHLLDELPNEGNGKFRLAISHVESAYGDERPALNAESLVNPRS